MPIKEESTIHDVCTYLKDLAEKQDDIFYLSLQVNGKVEAYQVFNKGDGKEGKVIPDFKALKNIVFTDTADKQRTTLLEYMKKFGFNEKNGDGELAIGFDGRSRTMNMIVIHNSNLGPPVGGLREKDYSNFDSMLTDTLRLARGMSYKAAMADSKTGGGKSTRTHPKGIRKEANLSTARFANFLNVRRKERSLHPYVIAEDSNTACIDFDQMDAINPWTACKSLHMGGTGNPSPITAIGVYQAAQTGAEFAFPDQTLSNKVVLLSGVGQVGYELLKNFVFNGVKKVICAEMSKERIEWVQKQFERMGKTDRIEFMLYTKEELGNQKFLHDLADKIDIFAPCALGKSINDTNIKAIKNTRLKLIIGAENNQLADEEKHGKMLHEMGILYVPDYVANGGGLIHCIGELPNRMFLISDSIQRAKNVGNTVREVLALAKKENIPTYLAANKLAEERML
ncbi:hypothetical protein GOV09_03080 [Candidatus Woesearchaeota archaeon]|nr:hypothetical protein [Candidatus Woesearchaeota archaeon]